jgi:hypothetical protein
VKVANSNGSILENKLTGSARAGRPFWNDQNEVP